MNIDEAQFLAQAITILHNPIFLESFDGNTAGPVTSYYLAFFHLLGFPLDYSTSHLAAIILQVPILIGTLLVLKKIFEKRIAFLSFFPILTLFLFTQHIDFLHLTSELIAINLLIISTYIYLSLYKSKQSTPLLIFIFGGIAAFIGFCKLQALPIMFGISLFFTAELFLQANTIKKFVRDLFFLFTGGVSVLAVLIGIMIYWNVLDQFLIFYIKGNFIHSSKNSYSFSDNLIEYFRQIWPNKELVHFSFYTALFALLSTISLIKTKSYNRLNRLHVFVFIYIGFTFFAISKSGFQYFHYLNFLFFPFTILFGFLITTYYNYLPKAINLLGIIGLIIYISPFFQSIYTKAPFYFYSYQGKKLAISETAKTILEYANPTTDKMIVWGWKNEYHVETQIPQGSCDNHNIRCFGFSLVDEHRERMMKNIKENKPKIFVDAVFRDKIAFNTMGLHKFEELNRYVQTHYEMKQRIGDEYIYVLK